MFNDIQKHYQDSVLFPVENHLSISKHAGSDDLNRMKVRIQDRRDFLKQATVIGIGVAVGLLIISALEMKISLNTNSHVGSVLNPFGIGISAGLIIGLSMDLLRPPKQSDLDNLKQAERRLDEKLAYEMKSLV